jgi:hypothetical protein
MMQRFNVAMDEVSPMCKSLETLVKSMIRAH